MPFAQKVRLAEGQSLVLTVTKVEAWQGEYNKQPTYNYTFGDGTTEITASRDGVTRQFARFGAVPENAVGMTLQFHRPLGTRYTNIEPVAPVAAGTLTAGLTPPTGYAGPTLPGEPAAPQAVPAAALAATAADFTRRRTALYKAATFAYRASLKIQLEDGVQPDANAVARYAGTILIQMERDRLIYPPLPPVAPVFPPPPNAILVPAVAPVPVAAPAAAVPPRRTDTAAGRGPVGRGTGMEPTDHVPPPRDAPPVDDEFGGWDDTDQIPF